MEYFTYGIVKLIKVMFLIILRPPWSGTQIMRQKYVYPFGDSFFVFSIHKRSEAI